VNGRAISCVGAEARLSASYARISCAFPARGNSIAGSTQVQAIEEEEFGLAGRCRPFAHRGRQRQAKAAGMSNPLVEILEIGET